MREEELAEELHGVARSQAGGARRNIHDLLTAHVPLGLFVSSASGEFEYVSAGWRELAGQDGEAALGEGWHEAVHPDDLDAVTALLASRPGGDETHVLELRLCLPGAVSRRVELRACAMHDHAGEPVGWVGACFAPAVAGAERAAAAEADLFRSAFEHAPIACGLASPEGDWLQVNHAFCQLVGYPEEELLQLNLADLGMRGDAPVALAEGGVSRSERRLRRADDTPVWVAASTLLVRDQQGDPLCWVFQAEDIAERKRTERELRQLADHDALTGLLNRRGFMDGLKRELRRMDRNGEYGALLVLDLDNFKLVNDTAGHLAGDQVLRTTADVLRRRLRATDVIGRLGGDEFAALVLNVTPRQAREIADETTEALRALTVTVGERTIKVAASIGVVAVDEMPSDGEDDLLAAADRAMYRTKSQRRDG